MNARNARTPEGCLPWGRLYQNARGTMRRPNNRARAETGDGANLARGRTRASVLKRSRAAVDSKALQSRFRTEAGVTCKYQRSCGRTSV
jgi:hypothetical protein